jgi:hypothetical protein
MTEQTELSIGERYRLEGLACTVLRGADVDFTGERQNELGEVTRESAIDAAIRMTEHIGDKYPQGLALLRREGIKV